MRRAHLILNPEARRVTSAVTHVVIAALESRFKLETTETQARDAGIEVARAAAEEGNDLLIAFGGDGLVNEVVNGIAGSEATLAIIPGGTMNVLARNLGMSRDPFEAVDKILGTPEELPTRSLPLSKANDRYFTFACGCGFDADAAAVVEEHKSEKQRYGEPYFYAAALATFFRGYFHRNPFLTCHGGFGIKEAVMAIALNCGPYAYLAGRPVTLGPSGDRLKFFTLRSLRYLDLPRYLLGAVATASFGPEASVETGVDEVIIESDSAFSVHVDGESLPKVSHLRISKTEEEIGILA